MTEKRGLLCGYTLSEVRLFYCLNVASSIDQPCIYISVKISTLLNKSYRSLRGRIGNRPLCFHFILEQTRLKIKPDPLTKSIVKENESPGFKLETSRRIFATYRFTCSLYFSVSVHVTERCYFTGLVCLVTFVQVK